MYVYVYVYTNGTRRKEREGVVRERKKEEEGVTVKDVGCCK